MISDEDYSKLEELKKKLRIAEKKQRKNISE
jgi:hypothetical protein